MLDVKILKLRLTSHDSLVMSDTSPVLPVRSPYDKRTTLLVILKANYLLTGVSIVAKQTP